MGQWPLRIWRQRVTFEIRDPSDIWSTKCMHQYLGIAEIALKRALSGTSSLNKCLKPSWQWFRPSPKSSEFYPKKMPKTILARPPPKKKDQKESLWCQESFVLLQCFIQLYWVYGDGNVERKITPLTPQTRCWRCLDKMESCRVFNFLWKSFLFYIL